MRELKIWFYAFLTGGFTITLLIRFLEPIPELSQNNMAYFSNILMLLGTLGTSLTYLRRTNKSPGD